MQKQESNSMRIGKKIDNKEYYKIPRVYPTIERDEDNKIAIVTNKWNFLFRKISRSTKWKNIFIKENTNICI